MNAVNLLPPDLRRGAGSPGRSGIAVYVVLGVLAAAVVLASVTALLKSSVTDRENDVARVEAEATVAEQRAATLTRYKALAADTGKRVKGIKTVAAGRVDWGKTLREVSESIGSEVYFSAVTATTASGTGGGSSGGGASNPLRGAVQAPAVEVVGCARNHGAVARVIARFRSMDAVQRVSLASSDTGGDAAAASGSAPAAGDASCRAGARLPAEFQAVIFLEGQAAPAGAQTTASAAQSTTTSPGGTK